MCHSATYLSSSFIVMLGEGAEMGFSSARAGLMCTDGDTLALNVRVLSNTFGICKGSSLELLLFKPSTVSEGATLLEGI